MRIVNFFWPEENLVYLSFKHCSLTASMITFLSDVSQTKNNNVSPAKSDERDRASKYIIIFEDRFAGKIRVTSRSNCRNQLFIETPVISVSPCDSSSSAELWTAVSCPSLSVLCRLSSAVRCAVLKCINKLAHLPLSLPRGFSVAVFHFADFFGDFLALFWLFVGPFIVFPSLLILAVFRFAD